MSRASKVSNDLNGIDCMHRLPLVLISSLFSGIASAACPPPYTSPATATNYAVGQSSNGACSVPNVDGVTAAIAGVRWNNSAHCGECLDVHGPLGSTVVRVTDECPDCAATGLDLSQGAFAKVADLNDGVASVTWERVDCPVSGGLTLQTIDSNPYYLKMLAANTNQGVSAIRIKSGSNGTWQQLAAQSDGTYQILPSNMLQSPVFVELTSNSAQVLDITTALPVPSSTTSGTYSTDQQFDGCTDRIFASDFTSDN